MKFYSDPLFHLKNKAYNISGALENCSVFEQCA
jgi:hypothetical protein